jgi:hypothetical protein
MSDDGSEEGRRGGTPRRAGRRQEFGGQVPPDLGHGGLREHQTKEAKLAENQDRVAGARAGQQPGDQDVSIETDR